MRSPFRGDPMASPVMRRMSFAQAFHGQPCEPREISRIWVMIEDDLGALTLQLTLQVPF
jgi:hypothetical protein